MKRIRYIIPLFLTALILGACHRDELYPVPLTSIVEASAFSTSTRIQAQVLGLYTALKNGNFYGGRYLIAGDVKGENFIDLTANLITDYDVWLENPTNSATAVIGLWQYAYVTINNCNLFIDGMTKSGTMVISATQGTQYIAEARLIRALSYYSLLQFYALPYANGNGSNLGVPLRLTGIDGPGESLLARSPVDSVYGQILADLNFAEANLPSSYSSAYNNTTRAQVNTAIALKTRVYLAMGDYTDLITEANKIVTPGAPFTATSGVPFALVSDYTKAFIAPYTTSENIFSLPMTTTSGDNPGTQNQLAYYFTPGTAPGVGNGEFCLNPAGVIADPNWTATDRRKSFVTTIGSHQWLTKYIAPSPYTDYPPVIRYSEVLLNLAEARVRSTNSVDPQAVALLNAVRNRSDPATTYTVASFATSTSLINAILEERNIEFLGEGIRTSDLMRLQQTIPAKGSAPSIGPNAVGYIWPISSTELSLNTLCVDN